MALWYNALTRIPLQTLTARNRMFSKRSLIALGVAALVTLVGVGHHWNDFPTRGEIQEGHAFVTTHTQTADYAR